jgi:hypothetical protein
MVSSACLSVFFCPNALAYSAGTFIKRKNSFEILIINPNEDEEHVQVKCRWANTIRPFMTVIHYL